MILVIRTRMGLAISIIFVALTIRMMTTIMRSKIMIMIR